MTRPKRCVQITWLHEAHDVEPPQAREAWLRPPRKLRSKHQFEACCQCRAPDRLSAGYSRDGDAPRGQKGGAAPMINRELRTRLAGNWLMAGQRNGSRRPYAQSDRPSEIR